MTFYVNCRCPDPQPFPYRARNRLCSRCLGQIPVSVADPEPFYERLRETYPSGYPPAAVQALIELARRRELNGRAEFGFGFFLRDNIQEALEEAADGINYCAFEALVHARAGNGDEDIDLALTAARHFAEAASALLRLRGKRSGDTRGEDLPDD